MRFFSLLFALIVAATPAHLVACETDYNEESVFESASVIYIAEVISVTKSNPAIEGVAFWYSTVKPVKALKGMLPDGYRTLSAAFWYDHGCSFSGDGQGAAQSAGSFIFVFEGLSALGVYPRGVQSFSIDVAEKPELIEGAVEYFASVSK